MRIGLAERTVVTALAHASVLVRNSAFWTFLNSLLKLWKVDDYLFCVEGKNLTSAELQAKLSEGEEVVKAVYRFAPLHPPPPFLLSSLTRFGSSSYQEGLWKELT